MSSYGCDTDIAICLSTMLYRCSEATHLLCFLQMDGDGGTLCHHGKRLSLNLKLKKEKKKKNRFNEFNIIYNKVRCSDLW